MSLVEVGLSLSAGAAAVGAVASAVMPVRLRPAAGGLATACVGLGGVLAGAEALGGQRWSAEVEGLLPLGTTRFAVDPLSGLFLLLIGAVAIAAGIYAIGYTAPGGRQEIDPTGHAQDEHGAAAPGLVSSVHDGLGAASRTAQSTLPVFVAAMLGVATADSVSTFLVLWELMALTSLVLVLAEHRFRPAVSEAGLWYAGMTHLGFAALLVGLAVFAGEAGGESFADLRAGAATMPSATRSVIFLLVLVGFASKAGAVPLHVWLPRAHPEAPSHVSALMSAAMVKLGIYGLIRLWFDLLGGGPRWWGVLVLTVGAVSALYGVLQASVSTDLKKLLGYSTTENVGLILMGIGSGALFAAQGNRTLASLLMAAALLHALNHAAFKALLFLGAGSVLRATGSRDLDGLGGLATRMPVTTAFVAIGAFAAAALPPSNGFVSEWLLLQGLIHSLPGAEASTVVVAVTMPLAVGVVALTAGLGAVTFVKAFGVGFLARPRTPAAAAASESPLAMRAGLGLAALGCAALIAVPVLGAPVLTRVVDVLPSVRDAAPVHRSGVGIELAGIAGSMSPLVILAGLALAGTAVAALARALSPSRRRRVAPLWACGAAPPGARMEYTATSFAEPLTRVFEDVLQPEIDIKVSPSGESRFVLERVRYRQSVSDRIEARLYPPVLAAGRFWGSTGCLLGERQCAPVPRVRFSGLARRSHRDRAQRVSGAADVSLASVLAVAAQVALVLAGAPLLIGAMRQVRALLEGRAGAGIAQPWRDLRKLSRKEAIRPEGTSIAFTSAPAVMCGSTLLIAAIVPLVSTASPLEGAADLFAVVSLLLLGTVALAVAGLDTGTAFGGMGASRAITIAALAEPTILVAGFALVARAGSSNLGALVEQARADGVQVLSPASLLAAVALLVVIVAETGRLPVDNPSTHLELTMVHEAMVLEYSGRDLAVVELASMLRLTLLLGLTANLFLPWGVAGDSAPLAVLFGAAVLISKVFALGMALAAAEVFLAKLRLFRVPELLAGSFLFGLLAVSASFFLT